MGDLCYVLPEAWTEVCRLIIEEKQRGVKEGEFALSDGRRFAIYSTAYGDGYYPDKLGNHYPVDSGTIGCVLVEDVKSQEAHTNYGVQHDFPEPFETGNKTGVIFFGRVSIDTATEDEE